MDEHDVAGREVMSAGVDAALHLCGRDRLAVRVAGGVDDDAGAEEALERQLVDRFGRRAGDRRVVVLGRVDMGRVVRAERDQLA